MKVRKLTITAILIAINIVLSSLIVIPLGPIKAAPFNILLMYYVQSLLDHVVWLSSSIYFLNFQSEFWHR